MFKQRKSMATPSNSSNGRKVQPPAFVVEELLDEARCQTGLNDFGDSGFLVALEKLISDIRLSSESHRQGVKNELVQTLSRRLRTERGWQQNPGYHKVHIERPLVICGVPRTGTTALHKLLSIDPQFQGLENWLCESPMPRPPMDEWESNPYFQESKKRMAARDESSPIFKMAHDIAVSEVDECVEVLGQEFVSNRFGCLLNVPEYEQWFRRQDQGPSYRRLADVMRLVGLNSDNRWLLKNPGHLGDLDALFEVFPGACVVVTSRDPVKSMPSLASIVTDLRRGYMADEDVDPEQVGLRELDFWSRVFHRGQTYRKQHPDKSDQFLDIDHTEFHRDPISIVKKIYNRFDLVLEYEIEERMRQWLAMNPAGKLGEHVYSLETFGLSEEMVKDAFKAK